MNDPNTLSEDFILLLDQSRRGRLQLHVETGLAESHGLGLLREASYLDRRGLEVVLGLVEADSLAAWGPAANLETLPPRRQEYRGLAVRDLDLAAALARRPQVLVVQDISHLAPPPGPARGRYQDVSQLLAAGISVLASVDIARLEDLPGLDQPQGLPGAHRQVPAAFWKSADQIILPPADQPGSVEPGAYPPWEALAALARDPRAAAAPQALAAEDGDPGKRLMVCLPEHPAQALELLRAMRDMDNRMQAKWFAVHVAPNPMANPALEPVWQEVRRLGGEPVRLKGRDPLPSLLEFARAHGVRHILLGRAEETAWKSLLGFSLSRRIIGKSQEFDLHVMALSGGAAARP